uniref:Large ribosomal subunit protein mL49 n=1 Tax=Ditylum brightwellii TaxID=49249 RepID=A0A6S8X8U7_9STRA|mmetsp:Transcript_32875/g.43818  ORF Transcript_32875/g.43818 Transcript_32875/m.43818 type:complete len:191 (-) Transcript_32875:173-745(-)
MSMITGRTAAAVVARCSTTSGILGSSSSQGTAIIRQKHSSTQLKRLFKKHPAKERVGGRLAQNFEPLPPPATKYAPVFEPTILSNGWSKPPEANVELPDYPFKVERTKNKPNDAIGFLPVYSKVRIGGTKKTTVIKRVTGDRDAFLTELRGTLGLPANDNEVVRIRTGGAIEVNGNRTREVKEWLAGLGF